MNKQLTFFFIATVLITASFSFSNAYAFDPQMLTMDLQDAQVSNFATYDVWTLILSIFNGDTQSAQLYGHSMLYLNDTNGDYWEYANYLDLVNSTSTDCPNLGVTINPGLSQNIKLCFLVLNDIDTSYSAVINNHPYFKDQQTNVLVLESVPDWFKTNADAWCNDITTDNEFASATEFYINEGTIKVLKTQSGVDTGAQIPAWVKNNACQWSSDQISDYEFLDGIYWLIDNGKIQL